MDGVIYAAISKNLAHGIGSAWALHYTNTFDALFLGHPPGMFLLESIFFKLFGNSFFIEKIFSLLLCIITIWGIFLNWKFLIKDNFLKKFIWFPILFWLLTYINMWSFQNNMLENLVTPLILFSVYAYLNAIEKNNIGYILGGSFLLFYAYLVKGPVSLFPLCTIFVYYISFRSITLKRTIFYTLISIFFVILLFLGLFWIFPQSLPSLKAYHTIQIFSAFNGSNEITVNSHFDILWQILLAILPMIIVTVIILLIQIRKNTVKPFSPISKLVLFWTLLALAGSLPLIITLKQRLFYAVPALPFFAIMFGLTCAYFMNNTYNKIITRKIIYFNSLIGAILIIIAFTISILKFRSYSSDKFLLQDITTISDIVGENSIIACDSTMITAYPTIAYLSRYKHVSLSVKNIEKYNWKIIPKKQTFSTTQDYTIVNANLHSFTLMKKNSKNSICINLTINY